MVIGIFQCTGVRVDGLHNCLQDARDRIPILSRASPHAVCIVALAKSLEGIRALRTKISLAIRLHPKEQGLLHRH